MQIRGWLRWGISCLWFKVKNKIILHFLRQIPQSHEKTLNTVLMCFWCHRHWCRWISQMCQTEADPWYFHEDNVELMTGSLVQRVQKCEIWNHVMDEYMANKQWWNMTTVVWHFGKNAYLSSCLKLDDKIDKWKIVSYTLLLLYVSYIVKCC